MTSITPVAGCAVVLLSPRLPGVLPAAALPALRAATGIYAGPDQDRAVWLPHGAEDALPQPELLVQLAAAMPLVLLTADRDSPHAVALRAAGVPEIGTPEPAGAALLDAVELMDTLRSPGGCPWDAKQTHESLRQYLVEETYELLDAIDDGDRAALREELGDVLLQVLFHSRVAAEDPTDPFTVDDVAGDLVAKLVGRHPHVFADETRGPDVAAHEHRWEELKQAEKQRESSVDGVAAAQPAVALAAKLTQRARRAGLPTDLLPDGDDTGATLFAVAALAKLAGEDPEGLLREVARGFAADVRAAESAARAAGRDPAALTADQWREVWPRRA